MVGRNLLRLRQARGLSQERLALVTGYSRQYLSGIESGRRNPTVEVLDVLAAALGVAAVDLLRPEGEVEQDGDC